MKTCILAIVLCAVNFARAEPTYTADEVKYMVKYTEDIGMPRARRMSRAAGVANEVSCVNRRFITLLIL